MTRVFFFLLGFGLMVIGCTYWVIYLNLLTIGYTINEYFSFALSNMECIFALVGFIMMTLAIFWKGDHSLDLHL